MENQSEGTGVTIKMPVSRWLKADERLSEILKEIEKKINKASELEVEKVLGDSQLKRIEGQIGEFCSCLEAYNSIQEERLRIRNEVARRNSENGVSYNLARIQLLKQRVELLKGIIDKQKPDMMNLEEYRDVVKRRRVSVIPKPPATEEEELSKLEDELFIGYAGFRRALAIRSLTSEQLEQMKKQVESLNLEIFELKNDIADSNAQTLTMEIPVEVAGYFKKI